MRKAQFGGRLTSLRLILITTKKKKRIKLILNVLWGQQIKIQDMKNGRNFLLSIHRMKSPTAVQAHHCI